MGMQTKEIGQGIGVRIGMRARAIKGQLIVELAGVIQKGHRKGLILI
jgi:hypothetical protein